VAASIPPLPDPNLGGLGEPGGVEQRLVAAWAIRKQEILLSEKLTLIRRRKPIVHLRPLISKSDIVPLDMLVEYHIQMAIHACNGCVSEAARLLGISRSTVHRLIKLGKVY